MLFFTSNYYLIPSLSAIMFSLHSQPIKNWPLPSPPRLRSVQSHDNFLWCHYCRIGLSCSGQARLCRGDQILHHDCSRSPHTFPLHYFMSFWNLFWVVRASSFYSCFFLMGTSSSFITPSEVFSSAEWVLVCWALLLPLLLPPHHPPDTLNPSVLSLGAGFSKITQNNSKVSLETLQLMSLC